MALRKIGGLWVNEGKNSKYMSGSCKESVPAGAKLMIFKNTHKQPGEKTPDYTINIAEDDQPAPRNEYQQAPTQDPVGPPPDEDIPF